VGTSVRNLLKALIPAPIKSSRIAEIWRHVVTSHDSVYTQSYYDNDVESAAVQAAPVMAEAIVSTFHPKTVVDVGCGTGALLEEFRNLDCKILGLEYSEAGLSYCMKRKYKVPVRKFNVEKDKLNVETYDIAVSFEVAEHLSPWIANRYVGLLCELSSVVVMSAATPGQSGRDHINEQPHSKLKTFDGSSNDIGVGDAGLFDLSFIDGEHTDEACFRDFIWTFPLMKPDSIIAFHDSSLIYKSQKLILIYLDKSKVEFEFFKRADSEMSAIITGKYRDRPLGDYLGPMASIRDFFAASEARRIKTQFFNLARPRFAPSKILSGSFPLRFEIVAPRVSNGDEY